MRAIAPSRTRIVAGRIPSGNTTRLLRNPRPSSLIAALPAEADEGILREGFVRRAYDSAHWNGSRLSDGFRRQAAAAPHECDSSLSPVIKLPSYDTGLPSERRFPLRYGSLESFYRPCRRAPRSKPLKSPALSWFQ